MSKAAEHSGTAARTVEALLLLQPPPQRGLIGSQQKQSGDPGFGGLMLLY